MAKLCESCGSSTWGTFTVGGVTHRDRFCAHVAATGDPAGPEGLRACEKCGTIGHWPGTLCPAHS